jgi:hypothetical protein
MPAAANHAPAKAGSGGELVAEYRPPTAVEIEAFTASLRLFRATLPESDQRLLDAMYHAAMGTHEQWDEEVHAYWVAAGRGGAFRSAFRGWGGRPWGVAYNTYYPYGYLG